MARAVAGEAQAAFLSIGPSDILSKYVGESEAAVRKIFKEGEPKSKPSAEKMFLVIPLEMILTLTILKI